MGAFAGMLLLCWSEAAGQSLVVRGYVTDAASGEVLIGAHVFDERHLSGTTTNSYGWYSLGIPSDTVFVRVSYIGYATTTFTVIQGDEGRRDVALVPSTVAQDTLVVFADASEPLAGRLQMSHFTVRMEDVERLPALGGEADVLKTLQLLPGVRSGTEGSAALYVRGGGPDQNLILLDGATVYNAGHLFGFISTFNTDALHNAELYTGGFPARFGGRLSSVLDLRMREGNAMEHRGTATVGLVASRATVEGPLPGVRNGSFIVSGRRTYLDLLTMPLQWSRRSTDGLFGYYFYDFNAKANLSPSARDRIFLSTYLGRDRLYGEDVSEAFQSRYGFAWRNWTSTLRWNRVISSRMFGSGMVLLSTYHYDLGSRYTSTRTDPTGHATRTLQRSNLISGIRDLTARADIEYIPSADHYVRFGGTVTHYRFTPGVQSVLEHDGLVARDTTVGRTDDRSAIGWSVYGEDELRLSRRLSANGGLHVSGFVVDRRVYTSAEPRLAARYLLTSAFSAKGSFAATRQYVHLLTSSGIGLPTDLWVPSTGRIPPQQAWQVTLGLARTFVSETYEATVEGYYKPMTNVIEYREGASVLAAGRNWESQVAIGEGLSRGIEMFAHKRKGRTTGWLGYTLSRTTRQFDDLNGGRVFPYRYDRRHDLSLAISHPLGRRTVSATWVYGTGDAVTIPVGRYADDGRIVDVFEGRNAHRMPAYHRLDLALRTPKRDGSATMTVSLYNVYNRRNPLYLFTREGSEFDVDVGYHEHNNRVTQFSLLPIVPAFSYSFSF